MPLPPRRMGATITSDDVNEYDGPDDVLPPHTPGTEVTDPSGRRNSTGSMWSAWTEDMPRLTRRRVALLLALALVTLIGLAAALAASPTRLAHERARNEASGSVPAPSGHAGP